MSMVGRIAELGSSVVRQEFRKGNDARPPGSLIGGGLIDFPRCLDEARGRSAKGLHNVIGTLVALRLHGAGRFQPRSAAGLLAALGLHRGTRSDFARCRQSCFDAHTRRSRPDKLLCAIACIASVKPTDGRAGSSRPGLTLALGQDQHMSRDGTGA